MNRNPYVILGIPFGASRAEANVAFARKARSLRRTVGSDTDQLTDLTWALQRIDEAIRNPSAAMELYRIPADPEAFDSAGHGVMRPPPERLASRYTSEDREHALAQMQREAAREFLRYLVAVRVAGTRLPEP
jgi:hypothetical protein